MFFPEFSTTTTEAGADGEFPSQRAVSVSPSGDLVAIGIGDKVRERCRGSGCRIRKRIPSTLMLILELVLILY